MADVWGDSGLSLMDSREEGDPGTYPNAPVMPQLTGLGLSQCPGLTHAPVGLFSWLPSQQSESDSYSGGWGAGEICRQPHQLPRSSDSDTSVYTVPERGSSKGMGGERIELGSTQQSSLRWLDARAVLPICWTRSVLVPTRSQGALNEPPATYPSEPWPSVHTGSHRGQPHIPMVCKERAQTTRPFLTPACPPVASSLDPCGGGSRRQCRPSPASAPLQLAGL